MEGGSECSSPSDDPMNSKYSIKNLLFYRAIPNYQIPCLTNGYSIYTCKDCGDGFILESSYRNHIQRKSVLIKYQCRLCQGSRRPLIFYNRCNLLSHIRSHTVRTATINVSDLTVESLPLSFFKIKKDNSPVIPNNPEPTPKTSQSDNSNQYNIINTSGVNSSTCSDCNKDITSSGILYKDRASHYMQYTNQVYSCPICLFNLPTACGLRAHLRVHLKIPPFYCPECGIHLTNKMVIYPYTHGCEGFNMMRATARSQCPTKKCSFFHPNHFNKHMTDNHFKLIYKCSMCVVACFNESTMLKHAKTHKHDICPQRFYQCDLCPGRLVMLTHTDRHIRSHNQISVHPCWTCNKPFKQAMELVKHHIEKHCQYDEVLKNMLFVSLITEEPLPEQQTRPPKKIYRVVKRCDQCMRSFTYKCKYEDIIGLPNSCPYNCVPGAKCTSDNTAIGCPLCKTKIVQNWGVVKEHFALHHKDHKCLDAKISIPRLNAKSVSDGDSTVKKNKIVNGTIKKRSKRKPKQRILKNRKIPYEIIVPSEIEDNSNSLVCGKCQLQCETKDLLEQHILTHKDPCTAYQCMECGECFVVKPSFSTHLLLKHEISDVNKYIDEKKCYNENAFSKDVENVVEEPLCENQCKICRERFDCSEDLEKHFRIHGMAFLMKNSLIKPSI